MFPIYPITETGVAPYGGQMVCAVMRDGTRYVGILSGCSKGKLMLNGYPSSSPGSLYSGSYSNKEKQQDKKVSSKKKKRNSKNKANPSAKLNSLVRPANRVLSPFYPYDTGGLGYGGYGYGGYGYGGPGYGSGYGRYGRYGYGAGLALDLALIAFLFLLII